MEKTINRYIPFLVNEFITKCDYKHPEHLIVICDMLYRVGGTNYVKTSGYHPYINISRSYFNGIITDEVNLTKALTYLFDNKIIETNGRYVLGEHGKGYRFCENVVSKIIEVELHKPTLVKKIYRNRNKRINAVSELHRVNRDYFLQSFQITPEAFDYLEDVLVCDLNAAKTHKQRLAAWNAYNNSFMAVKAIIERDLRYHTCRTNGRVHTNLTNLKSELKSFIPGDFVQIDIKNSQPAFLYFLIQQTCVATGASICNRNNFKEELETYKDWVLSGKFYEKFIQKLGNRLNRDQVKNLMFCVLFSNHADTRMNKSRNMFREVFPNIYEFIDQYKAVTHSKLANDLTRMESSICITDIIKRLNEAKIQHYTLHDAWCVNVSDQDAALSIIQDAFMERFGEIPSFKCELFSDIKLF